jgi:hypothetical protein
MGFIDDKVAYIYKQPTVYMTISLADPIDTSKIKVGFCAHYNMFRPYMKYYIFVGQIFDYYIDSYLGPGPRS